MATAKKLILAAKKGEVGAIRENLEAGISVDSTDAGDSTPLYWAAYKGHAGAHATIMSARRAQTLH